MTGTVLLLTRFLLLGLFCTLSSANPALTHYYDDVSEESVSRMVGVYRVVDETSCSCRLIFLPCPVEVQELTSKERTVQCPLLTRYCCQRATLINLTDAAQKLSSTPSPPSAWNNDPSATPGNQATVHEEAIPNEYDVNNDDSSSVSDAGIDQSSGAQGTRVELPQPDEETTTAKQPINVTPSAPACSCMTKYECQSQWPAFKHMPKYNFKTSIRCKEAKQVVCCFGRVVPPRGQRSPSQSQGTRGISKTPDDVSIWDALENLMAYFNSEE
ncbi:uncharacterized protein LOC135202479 [Macrobrachium nipponense]|uniref:uncharacterized protein LOC135202479 n=1 Tax=Macrobrachium nipponense TaxID=159736 RepID=UPI0030C81B7E